MVDSGDSDEFAGCRALVTQLGGLQAEVDALVQVCRRERERKEKNNVIIPRGQRSLFVLLIDERMDTLLILFVLFGIMFLRVRVRVRVRIRVRVRNTNHISVTPVLLLTLTLP